MIEFKFDIRKTTQVAAIILNKKGGIVNYMWLLKLLYFIDKEALCRWERSITGDSYASMEHGCVLSGTYDLIKQPSGEWKEHITTEGVCVQLINAIDNDELSRAEIQLIDEFYDLYQDKDQWAMRDICHDNNICPEWEDVGKSSKYLTIERILNLSGRMTKEEIQSLENEVSSLNQVKALLCD